MSTFNVPTRETVSPANQEIFDKLSKAIGKVPNLYATMAYSEHGLATYLALSNAKTSFRGKEKEAINLIVSQVNECDYCLAAHTAIGKMNGLTDDQILEIRGGQAPFDAKIDALVKLAKDLTAKRGHAAPGLLDAFFAAGYNNENLVDLINVIGDKTITNLLYAVTKVPVDFPAAPALKPVNA